MIDVFIICIWEKTNELLDMLRKLIEQYSQDLEIFKYGKTGKKGAGFILMLWQKDVPADFLEILLRDPYILDYGIFFSLENAKEA